jgi:NitT/TauT family transport system permease protein
MRSDPARAARARRAALLLPLGCAAVVVTLWHLAVVASGTRVFPSPAAVARGILALAESGHLWSYLRDSLLRVASGFSLALLAGVPLGLAMGANRTLETALNPVIQVLRPISPIAWIPLAIVIFGVGHAATVFLIFLASFFPVVVGAVAALHGVPAIYLHGGRNFGLGRAELLRRVLLPAAAPRLLAAVRIAFGVAWLVLVAAEMIAVDSGLGYLILDARNAGKRYDLVVAGMLLIGVVGLVFDAGFRRLERLPALRWGFRERET